MFPGTPLWSEDETARSFPKYLISPNFLFSINFLFSPTIFFCLLLCDFSGAGQFFPFTLFRAGENGNMICLGGWTDPGRT